ncbi:MAG TPA: DUF5412 family protein [Bacillales bacterium]
MCFILGIIGFRYNNSRFARLGSWLTVITSFFLSLVLFLSVIRPLIISEKLIMTTHSPEDTYTINLYLTNGGATTSFGVKGVIDSALWLNKTIYSDYNMDHAHVE